MSSNRDGKRQRLAISDWRLGKRQRMAISEWRMVKRQACWSGYQPRQKSSHDGKRRRMAISDWRLVKRQRLAIWTKAAGDDRWDGNGWRCWRSVTRSFSCSLPFWG
ncbi:MAG: hypothetical protein RRB24_09595 [Armatimonadota bacterium]|nr:hypothetical protein [Armatimonadota bacterium]